MPTESYGNFGLGQPGTWLRYRLFSQQDAIRSAAAAYGSRKAVVLRGAGRARRAVALPASAQVLYRAHGSPGSLSFRSGGRKSPAGL